jgi:hypothetical protein
MNEMSYLTKSKIYMGILRKQIRLQELHCRGSSKGHFPEKRNPKIH